MDGGDGIYVTKVGEQYKRHDLVFILASQIFRANDPITTTDKGAYLCSVPKLGYSCITSDRISLQLHSCTRIAAVELFQPTVSEASGFKREFQNDLDRWY